MAQAKAEKYLLLAVRHALAIATGLMLAAARRLRPRDQARIGRMLLDGDQWQGRQVVPAAWIDASWIDASDTGWLHSGSCTR